MIQKLSNHKIFVKDILYIEFVDRKSTIHKLDGTTIITNCTLKYWYDKLNEFGFAYPYKAFLVNFEYISAFKRNEIILINNEVFHFLDTIKKNLTKNTMIFCMKHYDYYF